MAEQRIKKTDVAEEDVFGLIGQSAEKNIVILDKFDKQLTDIASKMKVVFKGAKTDNLQGINQLVAVSNEMNKITKESIAIDKERKTQNDALKASQQALSVERAKEKEQLRQANLQAKQIAKLKLAEKDSIEQLRAKLGLVSTAWAKLTKEEIENTKRGQRLNESKKQLTETIKRMEMATGDARRNVGNYGSALDGLRGKMTSLLGAFGVGFGVMQIKGFIQESIELSKVQEKAIAQVEAGLKSTGNQAGRSLDQLTKQASDLQKKTLFGDEVILKDATAQLLTFTNISGEQFDRTQMAALDLATRLDGDLKSASIQLGKALNDPVANLSALSRSGIQFSKDQKEVINSLAESGRLAEAQTLILDELNKQYGGSAEAAANADGGITQLSNAFGDAKEVIGKVIFEAIQPMIKSLKEFFENLSEDDIRAFVDQLKTVWTVLKRVGQGFIAYKTYVIAAGIAQKLFGDGTGKLNISFKQLTDNLKKGSDGMGKFGSAMKGVGFAVAIGLAIEMAKVLYDIASGAKQAEEDLNRLNQTAEKATSSVGKNIGQIQDKLNKSVAEYDRLLKTGTITQSEYNKKVAESTRLANEQLATSRNAVIERKRQYATELAGLVRAQSQLDQGANITEIIAGLSDYGVVVGSGAITTQKLVDRIGQLRANMNAADIKIQEYNKSLASGMEAEKDITSEIIAHNKAKKDGKDKNDKYIETTDLLNEMLEREKQLLIDINNLNRELLANIDNQEVDVFGEDFLHMDEYEKALKRLEISLLNSGKTREEIAKEITQFEIDELQKRVDFLQTIGVEDLDMEKELAEKKRQQREQEQKETEAHYKKIKETIEKYGEEIIDGFIDRSKKREDVLDKELSASQKQEDALRELASQGNLDAQKSLAAQENVSIEKQRLKDIEAKKQAQLEELKIAYKAISDFMDGGDSLPVATVKGIGQTFGIRKLIAALPAFFKGTDDTGLQGHGVDGKGGFLSVLHPNERVLPKSLNDKLNGITNDELVDGYLRLRDINAGLIVEERSAKMNDGFNLEPLAKKIDMLNNTIKNKREMILSEKVKMGLARGLVVTEKRGNTTERTWYRPK